jgi:hypothetical protein
VGFGSTPAPRPGNSGAAPVPDVTALLSKGLQGLGSVAGVAAASASEAVRSGQAILQEKQVVEKASALAQVGHLVGGQRQSCRRHPCLLARCGKQLCAAALTVPDSCCSISPYLWVLRLTATLHCPVSMHHPSPDSSLCVAPCPVDGVDWAAVAVCHCG